MASVFNTPFTYDGDGGILNVIVALKEQLCHPDPVRGNDCVSGFDRAVVVGPKKRLGDFRRYQPLPLGGVTLSTR